mmetsp:Transcript_153392/g.268184  ORF Transcript_153392/g.268184 Transcript_153392/m.268184 type:complete len:83 (+) Transcript_153392:261-509(+)
MGGSSRTTLLGHLKITYQPSQQGVLTHYMLNCGRPLSATGGPPTTAPLFLAEKAAAWGQGDNHPHWDLFMGTSTSQHVMIHI